eukprot:7417346-Prorocentrum_lima.AAC.1
MAHTGQLDGLEKNEHDEQYPELYNRQEVKMMQGLINMMKQQLKALKLAPSSKKEVRDRQEDHEVRKEELYLPQAIQDE